MNRERAEIRVQDLLGRPVVATNGRRIGRIEEIQAEQDGPEYRVTNFLLGPGALGERLSIFRWFGGKPRERVVRWDQIDLTSDPIRLTCSVDELNVK